MVVLAIGLVAAIFLREAKSEPDSLACGAGELLLAVVLELERVLEVAVAVVLAILCTGQVAPPL